MHMVSESPVGVGKEGEDWCDVDDGELLLK